MTQKVSVNIVYSPQTESPHKMYENEKGEVWHSRDKDPNKFNIGMGWYSIRNPQSNDSLLVVEPFCVLEIDYDVKFAKKFQHIFTWASKAFLHPDVSNKVVEITHPTYHTIPDSKIVDTWPDWHARNDEIVFIANNKSSPHHSELYSYRLILADILDANSKFKISWYGQIPINRKYYKGKTPDKQEILKKAKFCVCTENSYDPVYTHNYLTEKMPDAWLAGAVPIYFGCYNVDDFGLPKDSYIDLREYSRKEERRWIFDKQNLVQKIENYSVQDYENYKNKVKTEIFQNGKLYELTAYEKLYKKMIDTFYKKVNG